ncbi:hypothetical protein [Actinoplanes derwentensis]|uniref:NhaP-type Na+/H+ or K+/H+ antiporter n=1 Tax=Actinoplanes derwentensis TaxID=113562 RepID=A0A1H1T0Z4_9ACTN|nr:hypothetical protein [Actinoplanes derwentensis]GID89907.1 hypothetical protein Ade03nite_88310 [Actinoplanes derwentensis]SDS53937.1 hypothetical protein SAMN04489716_1008 [Actinoplanes derwentensis]
MRELRWLSGLIVVAGLGWVVAAAAHTRDLPTSTGYQYLATALLAAGLYGAAHGISLRDARESLSPILFAATIGVLLKAALLVAAMYFLVDPRYAVVGLAVAQIDPLSVAALLDRAGMSERARTILLAWAAFDDPVTALLTVYAGAWLISGGSAGGGLLSYAGDLSANALLVAVAAAVWAVLWWAGRRIPSPAWGAAGVGALLLLMVWSVEGVLMLGLAVTGLFFRPPLGRALDVVLRGALVLAMFLLGLLLTGGVSIVAGILLGVAAFLAQAVAALVLPARLSRRDRVRLAAGQQNGITAVILALALEPTLPGTVAIVAPAILVVNVLHWAVNAALGSARITWPRSLPSHGPAPAEDRRAAS